MSVPLYLSVSLPSCLPIYMLLYVVCLCLYVFLSICFQSLSLSFSLCHCLLESVCLCPDAFSPPACLPVSLCMSVCLCVSLSFHLSTCPGIYISVRLSAVALNKFIAVTDKRPTAVITNGFLFLSGCHYFLFKNPVAP